MKTKTYLVVCVAVALAVSISILYIPGVSQYLEQTLLIFLSTNAR